MQAELTQEQQRSLEKLATPFHPNAISWRVTNKSRDGKRGCVIPYADQRAYSDRLNDVFSPAGWTRTYEVTTLSPVTRVRKDKTIQTGKVIVTCVVTIHDLGVHSGSGEMWADDDNAMTRAEAQAFKRACSCFGLGRYFYEFGEMWVDINEYGQPTSFPTLPAWALPPGVVPINRTEPDSNSSKSAKPSESKNVARQTSAASPTEAIDPALTRQIEGFRQNVGDALYFEVFRKGGPARNARDLPSLKAQNWILQELTTVERGINRIRELAEQVHENVFFGVLDALKVQSVNKIPSFEVLKTVVTNLQNAAQGVAA